MSIEAIIQIMTSSIIVFPTAVRVKHQEVEELIAKTDFLELLLIKAKTYMNSKPSKERISFEEVIDKFFEFINLILYKLSAKHPPLTEDHIELMHEVFIIPGMKHA
jgi:hypothetical protein